MKLLVFPLTRSMAYRLLRELRDREDLNRKEIAIENYVYKFIKEIK